MQGFVSADAEETEGILQTRWVEFNGEFLFVNAQTMAHGGYLLVEVELRDNAHDATMFAKSESVGFMGDSTRHMMTWKTTDSLRALAGTVKRFRFVLRHCRLFSFWVSTDRSGSSGGFLGTGSVNGLVD